MRPRPILFLSSLLASAFVLVSCGGTPSGDASVEPVFFGAMSAGGGFYAESKETFTKGEEGQPPVHAKSYINVWNADTGVRINGWEVSEEKLRGVDISADGSAVAVAWGNRLKIYDPATEHLFPVAPPADVDAARLSPDASQAYVLSEDDLEIYDVATGDLLERHNVDVGSYELADLAVSNTGAFLAIDSRKTGDKHVIQVFSLGPFVLQREIQLDSRSLGGMAPSPNGQNILISAAGSGSNSDFVEIYRLSDGQRLYRFDAVKSERLAWVDDTHVRLSRNGEVYTYEVDTGTRLTKVDLQ